MNFSRRFLVDTTQGGIILAAVISFLVGTLLAGDNSQVHKSNPNFARRSFLVYFEALVRLYSPTYYVTTIKMQRRY